MASRLSTAHVARWCARHPWLVVTVWLVVLALAGVAATGLGDALTAGDMGFTNRPESVRGRELLTARMGGGDARTETVVMHSETLTVDDPAFQAAVIRVAGDLTGLQGLVVSAPTYYQAKAARAPQASAMVSADRRTTLIPVTLAPEGSGTTLGIGDIVAVVQRDTSPAVKVMTVGAESTTSVFKSTAAKDLRGAELVGLPLTLGVLLLVFGAAVAAGLSILLAGVAILLAMGLTALVGHLMGLSFFVNTKGGSTIVGHTGSQAGFRAYFYWNPATKVAVIAAFNTSNDADSRKSGEGFRALRDVAWGMLR